MTDSNGRKDLISVIVPVYNVVSYLDQCVRSIVSQTYRNLQIILVDDGSTDGSSELCDRWQNKDGRITVIHKKNGGLSDARNAGIKKAEGSYISFIDSDDIVNHKFIEKLYKASLQYNADIVECGTLFINEEGFPIKKRTNNDEKIVLSRDQALTKLIMEDGIYQTVWNKLYKKKKINIDFPVNKINEDDFWTYRIFDHCDAIIVISDCLYSYRQRRNSITGKKYSLKMLDGLDARYERMNYFKGRKELERISEENCMYSLMYHTQRTLLYLDGEDKSEALNHILKILKVMPRMHVSSTLSLKYAIWFAFYRKMPILISNIRNILKIGAA